MKTIIVKDLTEHQYSNEDGDVLFNRIHNEFKKGRKVLVSFEGIYALNTSYINSAFVQLLDYYSYSFIKEHLMLINSTGFINKAVKHRIEFEFKKRESLKNRGN